MQKAENEMTRDDTWFMTDSIIVDGSRERDAYALA